MENPFEIINQRLERIEVLLENMHRTTSSNNIEVAKSPIMTIKQLSAYLDLSLSAIYKLTSSKEIPHVKRGKRLYFDKKDIDAWVLEHKVTTTADIEKIASDYIRRNPVKFP
ncbi:helix-turn-helix domain-containing protein [Croceibacter atlanticus]|uniref:helix-turn-helix domain-containing protein n=1 Tax=Croceibacter atlanticus TaxID=313588 RepID=UPI001C603D4D|nr:helix-turn-helix domain-containing protein [Croceibacter atlanticus]MBW4971174.1 helix-turn-helix domain-containing protein [Croceibacter atlanticus]